LVWRSVAVFAEAGIKVMLADIEKGALDAALVSLEGIGPETRGVVCDVADPASVITPPKRLLLPWATSTSCATTLELVHEAA